MSLLLPPAWTIDPWFAWCWVAAWALLTASSAVGGLVLALFLLHYFAFAAGPPGCGAAATVLLAGLALSVDLMLYAASCVRHGAVLVLVCIAWFASTAAMVIGTMEPPGDTVTLVLALVAVLSGGWLAALLCPLPD